MKMREKRGKAIILGVIMVAAMMPMASAQTGVSLTGIKLWHILLAISILLAILTFTYPLVIRIRRKRREEREEERIEEEEKRREEEVMKILRVMGNRMEGLSML